MSYYVYILANRKQGALYTGVTNDIARRVWEHKNKRGSTFTTQYHIDRLVYFEKHPYIHEAISREKHIKKWKRAWKISEIEKINPSWDDLYLRLNMLV